MSQLCAQPSQTVLGGCHYFEEEVGQVSWSEWRGDQLFFWQGQLQAIVEGDGLRGW